MNRPNPSAASAAHDLKEEIDRLTQEQVKALRMAVFVGMTSGEAQEYDERRTRITRLNQELAALESAR
jgi:hypothetical protein